MRQIGVRDEARMLGGYGSCGRPLCCTIVARRPSTRCRSRWPSSRTSRSNPSKLSGLCGRLKCCLRYELPNAKGQLRGGCGDEGGCRNPTGCGTGSCGSRRLRLHGLSAPMTRPRIALTVGDPAGIGPEIAEKAAAGRPRAASCCEPIVYDAPRRPVTVDARRRCRPRPGAPRTTSSCARSATRLAGRVDAIATAPVNKEAFALAGLPWRGHTDLLGHLTGSPHVAMMFDAPGLRYVLATVHIALARGAAGADAPSW